MLIGRGTNYAWSLTSADVDIIDTYAEKLCGGSKTKYTYKGKCRSMEKVDAGTIEKGGKTIKATFLPHGPRPGRSATRATRRPASRSRCRRSARATGVTPSTSSSTSD